MTMLKRVLKSILLIAILSLTVYARDEKKVTLSLMFWGSPEEIRIVEKMRDAFEKENPGISIKLIHANNYLDKLRVMIGGGTPPDVFYMGIEDFTAHVAAGVLMSMDSLLKKDTAWHAEDYFDVVLDAFKYNGKIYGIPKDWSPLVLYYNKDMFDSAGISYPDTSWTWDDFLSAAKKLTKDENGDGEPDQFGFLLYNNWVWALPWIWANGGRVLSEDKTRCVMDMPETIEALQFLTDLRWKYRVAPTAAQIAQRDLFTTGKVGMVTLGRWMIPRYRTIKDFRWGVAPLPKRKKRVTPIFTVAFVISSKCKHPDAAYRLVRFLSGEGGNKIIGKLGLAVPSIKSIAYSDVFLDPNQLPKNSQVYLDAIKYGRLPPVIPQWHEMSNTIDTQLDELWLNKRSAAQVCKELTPKINKLLSSNR